MGVDHLAFRQLLKRLTRMVKHKVILFDESRVLLERGKLLGKIP
jgi:hypothetical protein